MYYSIHVFYVIQEMDKLDKSLKEEWIYINNQKCIDEKTDVLFFYKRDNVYLSDNHLTALWAWKRECNEKEEYKFIHIDRHDDLGGEASMLDYTHPLKEIQTFQELLQIKRVHWMAGEIQLVTWDTYLPIAIDLYPQWFKESYFAIEDGHECYSETKQVYNTNIQLTHIGNLEDVKEIIKKSSKKTLLNIDIDYFFQGEGQARSSKWTDSEIINFAKIINELNKEGFIHVITIALSPTCCSNKEEMIKILSLICEGLLEDNLHDIVSQINENL